MPKESLMLKNGSSLTPAHLICKDKMRLTVTNICPDFPKKTEPESRQEIAAKLYSVFKKYKPPQESGH